MTHPPMDRSRLIIPALGGIYETFSPYTWLMVRVITGVLLIPHGYAKLFTAGAIDGTAGFMDSLGLAPGVFWAWVIALLEFFGGILLAVGFLTRPIAAMVVGFMAVAAFYVHWDAGFFWNKGGYEYPLMWGVVALAILIRGGGAYSVDRKLGREF
ncbi:MAG: DoxX family protein [Rhodospirillales bacterium]|nr:MAG: DoxX family protein [Rhodospirillales bacterium]